MHIMLVFETHPFASLSLQQLYAILRLRAQVFVVEQECAYQDVDDKDEKSLHLCASYQGKLVAYARIVPKGISYANYVSIGRVVVLETERDKGWGHLLMQKALANCNTHFPNQKIKISAQAHLEKFYTQHGFVTTGKAYLEDGIPHIAMLHE